MAVTVPSQAGPALRIPDARRLSLMMRAAGDVLRLRILRVLQTEAFGVQELASIFSMPQPGMSHHLKVLNQAGLVHARRHGNAIFYGRPLLAGEVSESRLRRSLYASVDDIGLTVAEHKRITEVHRERARKSLAFFERHAPDFAARSRAICDSEAYVPQLQAMISSCGINKRAQVAEVGPGGGPLLAWLAKHFDQVTAIDSSEKMLDVARSQTAAKNVQFVHGSLEAYAATATARFAACVFNMVLHHMASPSRAIADAAQLLPRGGVLVVADLGPHDQRWTKKSCGDLWLGFSPDEIDKWASRAGLDEQQSQYLGLRNGFQIQLRLFRKK